VRDDLVRGDVDTDRRGHVPLVTERSFSMLALMAAGVPLPFPDHRIGTAEEPAEAFEHDREARR
jgi:hypothetical protein